MKSQTDNIVFHIGYPKTATSWLQRGIYPNLPGVNYLGRSYIQKSRLEKFFNRALHALPYKPPLLTKYIKSPTPHSQWIQEIGYASNEEYQPVETRERLLYSLQPDKVNLISHEGLCKPYLIHMVAERLQKLAEGLDTKIVISIRRQPELIFSRYVHDYDIKNWSYTLRNAIDRTGDDFCNYPACQHGRIECLCKQRGAKSIYLKHYNFMRIYKLYAETFAPERIFILVFERLFSNPRAELRRYFRFLGLQVSDKQLAAFAVSPPQGKRSNKRKQALRELNNPGFDELMAEIREYYDESNAELNRLLGLGLEDYRYFTSPEVYHNFVPGE